MAMDKNRNMNLKIKWQMQEILYVLVLLVKKAQTIYQSSDSESCCKTALQMTQNKEMACVNL